MLAYESATGMLLDLQPGNVDLKAGGESSLRWIGMTPHAWKIC